MTEYTPEELDWLDDARRKQGELDAARAELDRLAEELAAARGETSAGTEQSEPDEQAGATEAPAVPSYEDLKAEVDAIPDNIPATDYYARLHEIQHRATAAPQPAEQLTGEDLALALVKAEQEAGGDRDAYYRAISEIPGAVETSSRRVW